MRLPRLASLLALGAASALPAQRPVPAPVDLAVTRCDDCAAWNTPQAPFRIAGNTWYVGTGGLSALLITSPEGHVLIDGALPESAPLIAASIRSLGFKLEDVKLLLNSHAHYDHAGGLAALQRTSGAAVALHPWSAKVLRMGTSPDDDPQFGLLLPFPGVRASRELADREVVRVGPLALTAHFTGGHTPGGTTWSWRSCEGATCVDVVYADSQSPISDDTFRYTGGPRYPTAMADFERGHARIAALSCDILITPHPGAVALFDKLARRTAGDSSAFREANACRIYVEAARKRLAERVAKERGR